MCDKDIICEELRYLKVKRYGFSENWEMIGDLQDISANKSHFLLEAKTCKKGPFLLMAIIAFSFWSLFQLFKFNLKYNAL